LGQLLDRGLTIRVSEEKETNREHLLFFSQWLLVLSPQGMHVIADRQIAAD
jgi:hypothetical protein